MIKNKIAGLKIGKKNNANKHTGSSAEDFFNSEEVPEHFDYDTTAYLAVMNPETKKYDMLLIRINLQNDTAMIEREPTRYDSNPRALQDTVQRITSDFVKGNKK